jgi:hypothetical protein
MSLWSNSYHMLVSSLPPLPPHFDVDRLPISPERLQVRLQMLEPEDAREIARVIDIVKWCRQFEESNDAAVVKRYGELMQEVTNPLVYEVLTHLSDVRMITTALRRRRRGVGPPPLGIGRWVEHIHRHFNQPDFGLGHVFPGIAQLAPLLEQGDVLNLHRGLEEARWADLKRRSEDYYFSFEAVALYVGRWDIIRRWLELRAERGRPIFETLVTEALGQYANIYS